MRVRTQFFAAIGVACLLFIIAFASGRRFRAQEDPDPRASTFATGRPGLSGLYEALGGLGIATDRWRERPMLFATSDANVTAEGDTSEVVSAATTFAVVAPTRLVSSRERAVIVRMLTAPRGSNLLVAGDVRMSIANCLGYDIEDGIFDSVRVAPPGRGADTAAAWVHAHLKPLGDSARKAMLSAEGPLDAAVCPRPTVRAVDTLLVTTKGHAAMLLLTVASGRRVLLVADAALLRNRQLRQSSTGPFILESVRTMGSRVVFDEYHHGYGSGGSMAGVAMAWSAQNPLGWMAWQLIVVGLLALLASGVRIGPVRAAIPRQRRSPLEHVRALATALAAARGHREAVAAMVRGLRRRLAATPASAASRDDWRAWLDAFVAHAPNQRVRASAEQLQRTANDTRQALPETAVLGAANAVEDVWQSLRP
ncbi:MAG: hypothetical protein IT359_15210 [Gemmatimonadaceae bacterium]|nr:hypothetical protein [Gemmatimonadaceae bacterium]